MTGEQLKIATDLKGMIDKLDKEIYLLMDITPSIRTGRKCLGLRGNKRKIKCNTLPIKGMEIELSNEDCRALIDIRTAECEALKQVLANIK